MYDLKENVVVEGLVLVEVEGGVELCVEDGVEPCVEGDFDKGVDKGVDGGVETMEENKTGIVVASGVVNIVLGANVVAKGVVGGKVGGLVNSGEEKRMDGPVEGGRDGLEVDVVVTVEVNGVLVEIIVEGGVDVKVLGDVANGVDVATGVEVEVLVGIGVEVGDAEELEELAPDPAALQLCVSV